MSAPLDAPASARRIGAYCWFEQQLFALFGRWVVEMTEPDHPEARLALLDLSAHAAWRAKRWYELLPTAPPGADALLEGTPAFEAALATASPGLPGDPTAALARAIELLDLLDASCAEHQQQASSVAEAAVLRIAAIARTDISLDRERAREVLES